MTLTKYLLLLAVALTVCSAVGAVPLQPEQIDFDTFAKKFQEDAQRQFEEFKRQVESGVPQLPQIDVKGLKKDDNTRVYGESETKYHVESNIDGRKNSESGGHRIINDDGKISEYDLH